MRSLSHAYVCRERCAALRMLRMTVRCFRRRGPRTIAEPRTIAGAHEAWLTAMRLRTRLRRRRCSRCVYVFMYASYVSVSVSVYTHIRIYIRTYIQTHLPTYLPTYIHTYIHTNKKKSCPEMLSARLHNLHFSRFIFFFQGARCALALADDGGGRNLVPKF
jgi:hypothetical protein